MNYCSENRLLSGVKLLIIIIIMLAAVPLLFAGSSVSQEKEKPFYPGEKLVYSLKWGFIHAGNATMEVLPIETVNGITSYHFLVKAESSSFIDTFYKVRDRIDAYADIDMSRSLLYKKKQHEGSRKRDIRVDFDWKNNSAVYSNYGNPREPVSLMPGTFDPLSAFYYTRFHDLKENMIIERPVSDGKKNVVGRVVVVRRETIKIGDVKHDSYLLEPELEHVKGIFEKSEDAKIQIWVSADKRRIPLMIKSKVFIGSFVGELVSFTDGSSSEKTVK